MAALVVVTLPLLPMLWRVRVRRRRLASSTGRTPADVTARTLAAWLEIIDTAWDHGIEPDDSQTPRKTAARVVRLGRLDTEAAAAVHRVAGAVEQVLYAPQPRTGAGFAEDVETVRNSLRISADRFTRIRAVVAPRSAIRVMGRALGTPVGLHRQVGCAVGRLAAVAVPAAELRHGARPAPGLCRVLELPHTVKGTRGIPSTGLISQARRAAAARPALRSCPVDLRGSACGVRCGASQGGDRPRTGRT
ncbi:DUF4129 domain-containing protein [Streptomyces yanii]|uniref:DUF4129 domain-containing protein n=1 Tax=Streptomyces yanii TaxID=78510 RepID=UPI0031F1A02A